MSVKVLYLNGKKPTVSIFATVEQKYVEATWNSEKRSQGKTKRAKSV
jgi:hypothetical protein